MGRDIREIAGKDAARGNAACVGLQHPGKAYGGLTPETKEHLRHIALTLSPKSRKKDEARTRFKAGTRLIREWKRTRHEVILTSDGYEYKGQKYKSLSPIASKITGTHWSGPAFFGTNKKGTAK